MVITKFNPKCGLNGDDFTKDRRTLMINYAVDGGISQAYEYSFPMDLLDDIGPKELASRIYDVFKQRLER